MLAYTDARLRLGVLTRSARPGGPVIVVNLCGPVGVGKSRLASALAAGTVVRPAAGPASGPAAGFRPADGPLVVDGVDHDAHADAVRELVAGAAPGTCVLVVGRRPLESRPGWSDRPVETVRLGPWSRAAVRALARSRGLRDPARLDLVADLSGGIPLIADLLLRALAAGAGAEGDAPGGLAGIAAGTEGDVLGGLADAAARELLRRLAVETADPPPDLRPELPFHLRPDPPDPSSGPLPGPLPGAPSGALSGVLPVVAAVGGADADLLAALVHGTPAEFDRLSAMSVVRPDAHGLVVVEPFRTIFELAYRWRHPVTSRRLLAKGAAYRRRQIAGTGDPVLRARLADQVLRVSAHPQVRETFFPAVPGLLRVRAATAADEDDIVRLTRQWADMETLDRRRADRMLDLWMSAPASRFDLVVDGDDRPLCMANLTRIGAGTAPVLEALLQQHATSLAASDRDDGRDGVVLGMMVAARRRPAAQAAMLRHILGTAMASGRVVVSTSWPPYQRLSARLGLGHVGETRDDLFGCGRKSGVFSRTFTPRNLLGWLRRLEQGAVPAADDALEDAVRVALSRLGDPRELAASPLATLPGLGSAEAIVAFVRRQVESLASSDSPVDREAAEILRLYHLRGGIGHEMVAHRLHLSRATYFRRLDHGVRRLAEAVRRAAATS
ncbi:hypothetical protein [Sphaerisporangium dianthi]|uniref:Uncharacterized protein n=1 Tax=Sphaerisporangium dianthi TaxID=1436120 RepID=A0ABV9C9D0_9ACTN